MESIIRKRRITINIFAVSSCFLMIISNIAWSLEYGITKTFEGFLYYSFKYIIASFLLIAFLLYTLFFNYKNKFRIFGIISTILSVNYFYIFNIFGSALITVELIVCVFEGLLIIIFSISLFKKLHISANIINTFCLLVSIGMYWLYHLGYLIDFYRILPGKLIFYNILYFIGFTLFLTTIYLMSFFQVPLEKKNLGESFMIGLGSFLTLVGFVLVVIGNSMNNDVSSQIDSFFESGKTGTGDNFVTFGILIAIIGIILLATGIALKIRKSSPKTIQKQKIYICRNCGEELEQNTKFCGNCGKSVMQIKTCPNCNNEIKTNYKFCQNCGFDLSAPQKNNNKI